MMNIDLEGISSFSEFFDSVDDEFLIKMYMYDPKSLYRMCAFLSLDLQLEKEHQEKTQKKSD